MFCQTMIGAAKMLMQGDKTPAELIRAVCSPGGTTLAGMQVARGARPVRHGRGGLR